MARWSIALVLLGACGGGGGNGGTSSPPDPTTETSTPPTDTGRTDSVTDSVTDTGRTDTGTEDTGTRWTAARDWGPLDAAVAQRMEARLATLHDEVGSPGIAAAVVDLGEGTMWVSSVGVADLATDRPWTPELSYAIGSVSKTYTTSMVLQLVDEGVVSLDDPLESWVSTVWSGQGVTVRHLIQHTSGIASYNYVGSFDGSLDYTPQELVDWAADREPTLRFAPGSQWEYSNTNFVLLGLIVEEATGDTFEAALQARLLSPLGLAHTSMPERYDAGAVRGYQSDDGGPLYDASDEGSPSMGWAAGGMQSTPVDVALWGAALFQGEVVSSDRLAEMTTPLLIDGQEVGYGLGLFGGIDADYGHNWGHTGGTGGQLTYLWWIEGADAVLVTMVNSFEGDINTAANELWIAYLDLAASR